ncbi:ketopantoate reductase family protein [Elusimicrobiota bacterium]
MKKQRIAILGVGAVGSILAAHLIKSGEEVVLVEALPGRLGGIRSDGVAVQDPKNFTFGAFTVEAKEAYGSIEEAAEGGLDAVFVCVKVCALKYILPGIKAVCAGENPPLIVSFQNGLDTEEFLAPAAGRGNVLRGVVNYAGGLRPDGAAQFAFFNKPNYLGALDESVAERAKELCSVMTKAGLDTEYTAEVKKKVWEKVILNSMLSPITALTGLTMQDSLDCEETRQIVVELGREGIEVAAKDGFEFPEGFLDKCMGYLGKAGHHKPSMLVDVEEGRESEIDFLNGKIRDHGLAQGLPVPYNKAIAAMVKGLDAKNIALKKGEKNGARLAKAG